MGDWHFRLASYDSDGQGALYLDWSLFGHTWTPPYAKHFFSALKSQESIAAIHPACLCNAISLALMVSAG
jgi:hypothetical protein